MKITKEGFIFKIVTDKAKELFDADLFPLYVLYDDDTESLIEDYLQLNMALESGNPIAIEVGQLL